MTSWLLPMRNGESEQARWAIRTWRANGGLGDDDRVITVGDHPAWLIPDLHIPGNSHRSGPANVWHNLLTACEQLSGEAVICNDDFYLMGQVDVRQHFYRSTLREHIARLPQPVTWWGSSLRLTHNYLRRAGHETPLSYELHRPMVVNAEAMVEAMGAAWNGLGIPPQWRTIYGVTAGIGGEKARDGKVVSRANFPPSVPCWSTTAASWGWMRETIIPLYLTPTRWERR